jgi:hypothetical protein
MKPSRIHYFFAEDRPVRIWLRTGRVLGMVLAGCVSHPTLALLGTWSGIRQFLAVLVLGLLLGQFAAVLVGWFVMGPLYHDRSLQNGEPFRAGDLVHILVGPHRDRVVRVLKTWNIGDYTGAHRVRVDLGEVWKDGEDVFLSHQVLLVERDEPEIPHESARDDGKAAP